jgi:hypothetical protein
MAVSDLVGVVIGGLIGLAGSIVPHLWEKRRARKSARAIARAYVSGILKMEEIRQHGSLYQQNIATLRAGTSQSLMKIFGAEDSRDELQSALVGQVGLLEPDVARDMVMFCNMLEGLRVDLKAIALGQMDNLSVAEKLKILEGDLKLWNDTQELGRDLMRRLD